MIPEIKNQLQIAKEREEQLFNVLTRMPLNLEQYNLLVDHAIAIKLSIEEAQRLFIKLTEYYD